MTTPSQPPGSPGAVVSVLADDLTGATDTVVQFRVAGWSAYLLVSDAIPAGEAGADAGLALARSLDTRPLPTSEAAAVTKQAVVEQVASGVERLYLKMDSTVRGSVAGQIAGALAGWGATHPDAIAVICPAYPRMGRTVVEGKVRVNGVDLDQSEAGFDPVTPVRSAELVTLIGEGVAVGTAASTAELAERIEQAGRQGATRVIVDAADDADLERLAQAVGLVDRPVVCVGSAGWARHLATAWLPGPAVPVVAPDAAADGPLVVCMTSLNEVALGQAEHLCSVLGRGVLRHQVVPSEGPAPLPSHLADRLVAERPDVILLQPSLERVIGADQAVVARGIARGLAGTAAALVDSGPVAGLVLVGGDGAEATLDALGATALRVDDQASEGVPLCRIVGGRAEGLVVATKAGGFGTPSTLTDVVTVMLDPKENAS